MNIVRNIFVGLAVICFCHASTAQSSYNSLIIGVFMQHDSTYIGLSADQVKKLETRIINIINTGGVTSNISASRISSKDAENIVETMARGIVCLPKFEIFDKRVADTGIKKIKVVDVSLTLAIQYIHEDIIFNNLQLQLQGSGNTHDQAINNVIRNLRPSDSRFKKFLSETRERIINYYTENCDDIMEQARQLDRLDLPGDALKILFPIPREIECYEEVKEMTVEVYRKYINKRCSQYMLTAKTLLAANKYDKGLETISLIDPTSQCAEEAVKLIESVKEEIDSTALENRYFELQMEMIRSKNEMNEEEMEKRIEKEVAKANKLLIFNTN